MLLPGNITLYWLDVWISEYQELLKLQTKFAWFSVSVKDMHLFMGGSWKAFWNKRTGKNIKGQASPQVVITVYSLWKRTKHLDMMQDFKKIIYNMIQGYFVQEVVGAVKPVHYEQST